MKPLAIVCCLFVFSCTSPIQQTTGEEVAHTGLDTLVSSYQWSTFYSLGHEEEAQRQADLVADAYAFLSDIMGPKENFQLLVLSREDWDTHAFSPVFGMPAYYQGKLIVGAGKSDISSIYEQMVSALPGAEANQIISLYKNDQDEFDLDLFFKKLVVHELTHSFQDPSNGTGYSVSRWLEELHANMGLYAYYKTKEPEVLSYLIPFVDFCIHNPPPSLAYSSLSDLDTHYYDMDPENYGYYQMRLTKEAQYAIDSLGSSILKPLNDFLIIYDESWKEKWTEEEFKSKLIAEVSPYFGGMMETWPQSK